jgi:hypothetical protein
MTNEDEFTPEERLRALTLAHEDAMNARLLANILRRGWADQEPGADSMYRQGNDTGDIW